MTAPDLHALIRAWEVAATAAQAGTDIDTWGIAGQLYARLVAALAEFGPVECGGRVWDAAGAGAGLRVRTRKGAAT